MDLPRTTFTVDVTLYPASLGGRTAPTPDGWYDCVCKLAAEEWPHWSCRLLVHGVSLVPGETRRVPVLLPEPECGALVAAAGRFLLWEGGTIRAPWWAKPPRSDVPIPDTTTPPPT